MATRSNIGIYNEDGTVRAIYAHWDGYPDHNGRILAGHYNQFPKIVALLEQGSVSSLGREIGEQHSFDARPDDSAFCTFYSRDRGEPAEWNQAQTYDNPAALVEHGEQYVYVWYGGEWWVYNRYDEAWPVQQDGPLAGFARLTAVLALIPDAAAA